MKVGLVGYQGSGKSTIFELLTGDAPDLSKAGSGQLGVATVPDATFDALVKLFNPKKVVPAKVELFDTPGLNLTQSHGNAQRLSIIREATALMHVIGVFNGAEPEAAIQAFDDDLVLADMTVVNNRVERLKKDVNKPRPDRDELRAELEAIEPIAIKLSEGIAARELEFTEAQEKFTRSFALLTRKRQIVVLNTADANFDEAVVNKLTEQGHTVVAAPLGLELELMALDTEEREMFAEEMGLGEPSREQLLQAVFKVTDQITFYTSGEKEVHAWLMKRGGTALDAADSIHSDLARAFIRAEIMSSADLLRLGSERELKAAGLHHVEGKEYIVQHGDEIFIKANP